MSEELKNFQNTLSTNNEMKQNFVDSKQNESSSEDDSDSGSDCDHIKISSQRKKNKNNKNKNLENMLLEQSIIQQNAFLKAQKTIYKLKSEIDSEEVKTRYLKLELNSLQVELREEIDKNKILFRTQVENWTLRTIVVLYIIWSAIHKIM
jgi:hypothetical protein